MRRREFIALFGGTVIAWPFAALAQQPERMRHVGVIMGIANDAQGQAWAAAFVQALAALGWKDGANLRIDWRWAGGDHALIERYAADLVALGCDVLQCSVSLPSIIGLCGSISAWINARNSSTVILSKSPGFPDFLRSTIMPQSFALPMLAATAALAWLLVSADCLACSNSSNNESCVIS
jgi:hypothetical protein